MRYLGLERGSTEVAQRELEALVGAIVIDLKCDEGLGGDGRWSSHFE